MVIVYDEGRCARFQVVAICVGSFDFVLNYQNQVLDFDPLDMQLLWPAQDFGQVR